MTTTTAARTAAQPKTEARTCRLTLRISGTDYIVKRVKGGAVKGWRLKKADDGTVYTIAKDQWGQVSCDCPSAKSGRCKNGECKHIRATVAVGLIAPSYRAANKRSDAHEAVI
jgi:hypothetical protein